MARSRAAVALLCTIAAATQQRALAAEPRPGRGLVGLGGGAGELFSGLLPFAHSGAVPPHVDAALQTRAVAPPRVTVPERPHSDLVSVAGAEEFFEDGLPFLHLGRKRAAATLQVEQAKPEEVPAAPAKPAQAVSAEDQERMLADAGKRAKAVFERAQKALAEAEAEAPPASPRAQKALVQAAAQAGAPAASPAPGKDAGAGDWKKIKKGKVKGEMPHNNIDRRDGQDEGTRGPSYHDVQAQTRADMHPEQGHPIHR